MKWDGSDSEVDWVRLKGSLAIVEQLILDFLELGTPLKPVGSL